MKATLRSVAALGLVLAVTAAAGRLVLSADGPGFAAPAAAAAVLPSNNVTDEPEQVLEARRRSIAATVIALALFGWLTRRWP